MKNSLPLRGVLWIRHGWLALGLGVLVNQGIEL